MNVFRNKCYKFLPLWRTNDKTPSVFHSDEKALFCMRDEHPHFAVFVVPKMAKAAIHSATTECTDGFVEKTTAVFNDAA